MRLRLIGALGGAAVLASACASSGGHNADHAHEPVRALLSADVMMFVSWDTNGDLSIGHDEIEAGVTREFARADSNHDGQIQPIEFENWSNAVLGGSQMGPFRLDFDRNVDNVITHDEFTSEIEGRVRDYDTNSDGALTRNEFVRLVGQARPPAVERPPLEPQR